MKNHRIVLAVLIAASSVVAFAKKNEQSQDFPLQVHIVRVDMAQGQRGANGGGSTDSNGNYSSNVSGGESYLYHLYIVHIEGDQRELAMTTPAAHSKGGKLGVLPWVAAATTRQNASLHLGDYKGHWNRDGSLEVQFVDEKGELKHQPFFIRAETPLPAEDKQSAK